MKRTFFKLRRNFVVRSTTNSSRFEIDIDVEEWKGLQDLENAKPENADDWHFEFRNVEEQLTTVSADDIGTYIEITGLYPTVTDSFALENFVTRLEQEISLAHAPSIDRGLAISVNGIPLRHQPQTLFVSDKLKPAFVEKTYPRKDLDGTEGATVRVKLFAGVAERSLHDGGWYIFCNGRMVLRADQTATTIWGQSHGMREYHTDFAFFRGFAYFDSDDAGLLPWTTTKTGVDADSPVYRNVQQEMIEVSKPVLNFLSNLAKETAAIEAGDSDARRSR